MTENVLLYSGGMDSYCLNHIFPIDKRVYVDIGTEESHREIELLIEAPFDVEIITGPNMEQFKLQHEVVPFRNSIFVMLAANFGNTIYLGSTAEDIARDNNPVFKSQMEAHLNYFTEDDEQRPVDGYPYDIIMPFSDMDKVDILERALEDPTFSIKDFLRYSTSCYEGQELECGNCKSCHLKGKAMKEAGIGSYIPDNFETDPLDFDHES